MVSLLTPEAQWDTESQNEKNVGCSVDIFCTF